MAKHKKLAYEDIYHDLEQVSARVGNFWGGHITEAVNSMTQQVLGSFRDQWLHLAKDAWDRQGNGSAEAYLQHYKLSQDEELKHLEKIGAELSRGYWGSWDRLRERAQTLELDTEGKIQNWVAERKRKKEEQKQQWLIGLGGVVIGLIVPPMLGWFRDGFVWLSKFFTGGK
ncbi:MAG: hypothetical protein HY401_09640 [Elusimicrobia bacterium]|nr:hypothetical protein [Elusimicrobiota bacterium]